jgi:hypothetical protein
VLEGRAAGLAAAAEDLRCSLKALEADQRRLQAEREVGSWVDSVRKCLRGLGARGSELAPALCAEQSLVAAAHQRWLPNSLCQACATEAAYLGERRREAEGVHAAADARFAAAAVLESAVAAARAEVEDEVKRLAADREVRGAYRSLAKGCVWVSLGLRDNGSQAALLRVVLLAAAGSATVRNAWPGVHALPCRLLCMLHTRPLLSPGLCCPAGRSRGRAGADEESDREPPG